MTGRIEKICSFVLLSKIQICEVFRSSVHSDNLSICQSNTLRIPFSGTVTHTDEKTRFSRALQNPLCRSFPSLRLLPVYKAIIPCASRYTPRSLPGQSSCHTDWDRNRLPSKEKTGPRSTPTYRPKSIFPTKYGQTQKVLRRKKVFFQPNGKSFG